MKLIKIINPEEVIEKEASDYKTREAVRTVVFNNDNHIALLKVPGKGYHKLPGGGIEKGEDNITALKRECDEEINCEICPLKEIGKIVEYRKNENLKQTSYFYTAKVGRKKYGPNFTEANLENVCEIEWIPIEEALQLLLNDQNSQDNDSSYILERDISAIKEALNITKSILA